MPIPEFIDLDDCEPAIGAPGFLVETLREGVSRWSLRTRPAHTNQSNEPILDGWCGETNNVSVFARGLALATVRSSNDRVRIRAISGDDIPVALLDLAYPELTPE